MSKKSYYYGTDSRYSDCHLSIVTKLRDIGGRVSIAHFKYPHQAIEWKDRKKYAAEQFYKLNNQYIARAWSENEFHHRLRSFWLPDATRYVFETCHGEKELVPLEIRYILKWVNNVLELPMMKWPAVYVLSSGEDGPLITTVATNDGGQPSK